MARPNKTSFRRACLVIKPGTTFSRWSAVLRETTPSSMAAAYLNTIPNNCVRENSLKLSGYGIGFSSRRPWFESCPDVIFLPCIYPFVSLLRTLFVRAGYISQRFKFRSLHCQPCVYFQSTMWSREVLYPTGWDLSLYKIFLRMECILSF